MRPGKFFFFICLILIGWYVWHHYVKDTPQAVEFVKIVKSEVGHLKETKPAVEFLKIVKPDVGPVKDTKPDVEVSAAGFKKVPWIEGASDNEVLVIGPT
jgi:hypothetical protein